jgi:twitching motility protein PilT
MTITLDDLLKLAVQKEASDLHLKAGIIPVIRRHGSLRPLSSQLAPLSSEQVEQIAYQLLDQRQVEIFNEKKEVDVSYNLKGFGRFRVNIFQQRGTVRVVIRHIPERVPTFADLQLPALMEKIAMEERGLVLVTGTTGSGKSSTLAAMVDFINRNESKHIIMIEDPAEFSIRDKKSIITQRELGTDTLSFAQSLRSAMRQDPDVILIGEMRDKETIEIALQAAETGHLVMSTLHTVDAQESINRILIAFEPHQQTQIRLQLATVLRAVISQRLIVNKEGTGYVPAIELLLNTGRMAELIADPKRALEIRDAIEEGQQAYGMCSFDQSLMALVAAEKITFDEAMKASSSPENFAIRYSGISHMDGKKWGESTKFGQRVDKAWQDLTAMEMETATSDKSQRQRNREEKPLKKASGDSNQPQSTMDKLRLLKKLRR